MFDVLKVGERQTTETEEKASKVSQNKQSKQLKAEVNRKAV